jgi:potassium efflux system protein
MRVSVPVGIACGSDVKLGYGILKEIADDNPNVVDDPAPSIICHPLGDNALQFTARCFIDSVDSQWPVTTSCTTRSADDSAKQGS